MICWEYDHHRIKDTYVRFKVAGFGGTHARVSIDLIQLLKAARRELALGAVSSFLQCHYIWQVAYKVLPWHPEPMRHNSTTKQTKKEHQVCLVFLKSHILPRMS